MVKRVFSLALFSLAVVFFIGCGGDDSASNSSGTPTVVAERGASHAADPNRDKQPRARLPIEARKNKQIATKSGSSDDVQPSDDTVSDDSADDTDASSETVTPDEGETVSPGEAKPVKTAAKKTSSAKKSSKRPKVGALGSASPPKIPIMAEPTGNEGISAGDTVIEIEGKDVDGEEFALSDYAGKVVMLDFWGDW